VSHPVEPIRHHLPRQDRSRLAKENEESGLKSILCVMVVEDTAAHSPNHRAVPPDEGCEGRFVTTLDKALQQLSIGQASTIMQKHGSAKMLDDLTQLAGRHFLPRRVPLYLLSPARQQFDPPFSLKGTK
jgi:hypothetical protein